MLPNRRAILCSSVQSANELVFLTTCGPATTFDPKITGCAGTWFFDDGTTLAATSGAEISKIFATDGLHRAVFRPAPNSWGSITLVDANTDLVVSDLAQFSKLINVQTFYLHANAGLRGDLRSVAAMTSMKYLLLAADPLITGDLSSLAAMTQMQILYLYSDPLISGSISSLSNMSVLRLLYLYSTNVSAGSISGLVAIQDLRIYSMGWLTADVDTVIDSMWAARANYTYATPALQIGGTNQAMTGNVIAPEEGDDWHQDGATWIPLTTGAKAYDLAKDVNGEGFKKWTITYTGGSITPEKSLMGNVIGTGEKTWTADGGNATQLRAQKFLAVAGTLQNIKIKCDQNVAVKVAIYSDNAGSPDALIAYSAYTNAVTGWNTISLNTTATLTATYYWLAMKIETSSSLYYIATGGTTKTVAAPFASDFPATFPASTDLEYDFAIAGPETLRNLKK